MTQNQAVTLRIIDCSGPDSQQFLHSQLCSDVLALQAGEMSLSGYCNLQGRLISNGFIACSNTEEYSLMVPEALAELLSNKLQRYVLRAKLAITLSNDSAQLVTIEPDDTAHWTSTLLNMALVRNSTSVRKTDEHTTLNRFKQGIALLNEHTAEKFLPQMLNLDQLGGLSFSKGCYPGQEIVARTQHLGKLKQRLFLLSSLDPQGLTPGDRLFSEDGEQAVATVLESIQHAGESKVLAVVRIGYEDQTLFSACTTQQPRQSYAAAGLS